VKRTLLLACLAVLGAPAVTWALDGELTVYGTLTPFLDNARITGQTTAAPADRPNQVPATAYNAGGIVGDQVPQRFRLSSATSNIGFKGGLDLLGEDLQAFFQVENSISLDGGAPASWATRNSAVGLKGKFGRFLMGNWDTPYKIPIVQIASLRAQNPFEDNIIGNPGFGVPATTTSAARANAKSDAAFSRRQGNSVQYWTPDIYGFSARLAVSLNQGKTAATATVPSISPTIYSASLMYTGGPVTVRYLFERHSDYFGLSQLGGTAAVSNANKGSTDDGHQVVLQLALPTNTKISAQGERLSYKNDDSTAAAVKSYTRNAYYVLLQQRFGDHQLFANFGQGSSGSCSVNGGAACTTSGLGATQFAAGYSYSIGKSCDVYAAYYQMRNGKSASYNVVNGPLASTAAPLPGGDISGFGVGVLYTFAATATSGMPKGL